MKTLALFLLSCFTLSAQVGLRSAGFVAAVMKPVSSVEPIITPTDIAGCRLWLDATLGTYSDLGVTPAGNDTAITQWSDRSGYFSPSHFTSETAGKQPTNYVNVIGTNSAVWFNGGQYVTNRGYTTNFAGVIHTTNMAIYFLGRTKIGVTANQRVLLVSGSQAIGVYSPFNDGKIYFDFPTSGDRVSDTVGFALWTNSFNLLELTRNGGLSKAITNGVDCAAKSNCAVDQTDDGVAFSWVGASSDSAGQISGYLCEVLIYSPCPSDADRCRIRNYFKARYSLGYATCSP